MAYYTVARHIPQCVCPDRIVRGLKLYLTCRAGEKPPRLQKEWRAFGGITCLSKIYSFWNAVVKSYFGIILDDAQLFDCQYITFQCFFQSALAKMTKTHIKRRRRSKNETESIFAKHWMMSALGDRRLQHSKCLYYVPPGGEFSPLLFFVNVICRVDPWCTMIVNSSCGISWRNHPCDSIPRIELLPWILFALWQPCWLCTRIWGST